LYIPEILFVIKIIPRIRIVRTSLILPFSRILTNRRADPERRERRPRYNLLATKNKEFHDFKEGIRTILSENQLALALQKKKKVKWTVDEISKAFTIRYLNKRCYLYLRNTLNYKLPGISSLQRWASRINMRQGVLQDVLRVMQAIGLTMTDIERTTVLAFDEIKVFSLYEYDKQHDEILGPHKYMQVVMARGLFTNWKQPISVNFDTKMTKSI